MSLSMFQNEIESLRIDDRTSENTSSASSHAVSSKRTDQKSVDERQCTRWLISRHDLEASRRDTVFDHSSFNHLKKVYLRDKFSERK